MAQERSLFKYDWSQAKTVEEAAFLIKRGAIAVSVGRLENDEDFAPIKSGSVEELNKAIASSPKLVALSLRGCGLDGKFISSLVERLGANEYLESLDLSDNEIGDDGAEAVGKFLEQNWSLKHLDLSSCGLKATGANHIVDGLESNYTVRSLILDDNEEVSTSSVLPLFEHLKTKKNIVNLSLVNTYCDFKHSADIFSMLKRNQNILYLGFPTFYTAQNTSKYVFASGNDSSDSSFSRDDCIQFHDNTVQKPLQDCLKSNFSLTKIYNPNPRNDVQLILKRNLKLMRNEFNDILLNDSVTDNEVNEQKIILLGTKNSGKTSLMNSLFGENFVQHSKFYELQFRKKLVLLKRTAGISHSFQEVGYDFDTDLSFKVAAKILSKKSEKMKKNEKFLKLSKAIAVSGDSRQRRRGPGVGRSRSARNRLRFFNVPNPEPVDQRRSISRRQMSQTDNGVAPMNRVRNFVMDTRGRFDSTRSDPVASGANNQRTSSSFDESQALNDELDSKRPGTDIRLAPSMRQTEIVDYFNPELVAKHGNNQEKSPILLRVREISNRVENNASKGNSNRNSSGDASALRRMASLNSTSSTYTNKTGQSNAKKRSEADRYGDINANLIDFNHVVYGIKNDNGIYVIVFDIKKVLKYVDIQSEKVILNNPITSFIKQNLNAIFNNSRSNTVVLVGTHYSKDQISDKELGAANRLIEKVIKHRYLKRLMRFKQENESTEDLCFFPVDSLTSVNMDSLRNALTKKLTKSVRDSTKQASEIPVKWLRLLDVLRSYKKENKNFVSKDSLLETVTEFGFSALEQIEFALEFLHDRGEILYFKHVELLKDFVVLNKTFLYFCGYQLLSRRYLTKMLNDKHTRARLRAEKLGSDFLLYQSKKLLSRDLIEFLWRNNNHYLMKKEVSDTEMYYDTNKAAYLYIMEILKKVLVVTEWKDVEINTGILSAEAHDVSSQALSQLFVVSSLLKNNQQRQDKSGANTKNVRSLKDIGERSKSPTLRLDKSPVVGRSGFPKLHDLKRNSKRRVVVESPSIHLTAYKPQATPESTTPVGTKSPLAAKFMPKEEAEASAFQLKPTTSQSGRAKAASIDASFIVSSRGRRVSSERPMRARGGSKDSVRATERTKRRQASKAKTSEISSNSSGIRSTEASGANSRASSRTSRNSKERTSARRVVKKNPARNSVDRNRNSKERQNSALRISQKSKTGGKNSNRKSVSRNPQNRVSISRQQKEAAMRKNVAIYARLEHMTGNKQPVAKLMQNVIKKMDTTSGISEMGNSTGSPTSQHSNVEVKYMIDINRPVSLIMDFKQSFLPDGLFLRICSLLHKYYSTTRSKEARRIEQVDLHGNFFKLTFDRCVVEEKKNVDVDAGASVSSSEYDSISVVAEAKKLIASSGNSEREYILMYKNSESIVCVVRNHDHAPQFLRKLRSAIETLEGVNDKDVTEHGMMLFNLSMTVRVEVKNNKFIEADQAQERNLAPWFSKNKLVKRRSTINAAKKKFIFAPDTDAGSEYSGKRKNSKESEGHFDFEDYLYAD